MHLTSIAHPIFRTFGRIVVRGSTFFPDGARTSATLRATLLGVSLLALAPGSGPASAQVQAADPAVLQAYANAYNSGDAAAAAASFTDNAVWVRPPATGPCSQQTPCVGQAAILRQLQAGVATNQCLTILATAVAGSVATATVEVRADNIRAGGVERILNVWLMQVAEDKIAALYVLNDLTDPQTSEWRAGQAGTQAPGAPIPNPTTPCGSD